MPTTGSTVSDPGDGPRSTDIPAEHGWHRREWWTSVALLPAVAGAWALTTWGRGGRCSNVELAGSFAGSRVRFVDILVNHHPDGRCIESGTGSLRWHLALGSVLAVVNAIVLFSICTRWWKRAWSTKRFVSASSLRWLGVVAMAFDLGENAILAFSVRLSSGRGIPRGPNVHDFLGCLA